MIRAERVENKGISTGKLGTCRECKAFRYLYRDMCSDCRNMQIAAVMPRRGKRGETDEEKQDRMRDMKRAAEV